MTVWIYDKGCLYTCKTESYRMDVLIHLADYSLILLHRKMLFSLYSLYFLDEPNGTKLPSSGKGKSFLKRILPPISFFFRTFARNKSIIH